MTQLLDRIWCRIFHKSYHIRREMLHGWQFVHCTNCKITWPERCASDASATKE
jgi:hypothetical protein